MTRVPRTSEIEAIDPGLGVPAAGYAVRHCSRIYRVNFTGDSLRVAHASTRRCLPEATPAQMSLAISVFTKHRLEILPGRDEDGLVWNGPQAITNATTFGVVARTLEDGIAASRHLSAHQRLQLAATAPRFVAFAEQMVEHYRTWRNRLEESHAEEARAAGATNSRRSYPPGTLVRIVDSARWRGPDGEKPEGRFLVERSRGRLILRGVDGPHQHQRLRRARGMRLERLS